MIQAGTVKQAHFQHDQEIKSVHQGNIVQLTVVRQLIVQQVHLILFQSRMHWLIVLNVLQVFIALRMDLNSLQEYVQQVIFVMEEQLYQLKIQQV